MSKVGRCLVMTRLNVRAKLISLTRKKEEEAGRRDLIRHRWRAGVEPNDAPKMFYETRHPSRSNYKVARTPMYHSHTHTHIYVLTHSLSFSLLLLRCFKDNGIRVSTRTHCSLLLRGLWSMGIIIKINLKNVADRLAQCVTHFENIHTTMQNKIKYKIMNCNKALLT